MRRQLVAIWSAAFDLRAGGFFYLGRLVMQLARMAGGISQRPLALGVALAIGLGFTAGAYAQSTTGAIFGEVQPGAASTVEVKGTTGITREVGVDAQGRYNVGNLPLGNYTVNIKKDGAVVDSRKNVSITVGGSTEVSFAAPVAAASAQSLDSVTVTANGIPPIDTTQVDARTVVTAETLARLPLGRNAEAIALLAPGAVAGSSSLGRARTVSFGGSGASENAYYINGFNSSDPYKNLGGVGLPYGAIDQQEVYTGGYSAKYGRSDGGVISQVGKRGTNEWHFGAQALWEPEFASASQPNVYYPSRGLPAGYGYENPAAAGTIYQNGKGDKKWTTTYSAYAGGPLIKDKLFFFIAAEAEKSEGNSTANVEDSPVANNHYTYNLPKYYAKLDWNINDSNILELTGIKSTDEQRGTYYDYDYDTRKQGASLDTDANTTKITSKFAIAKYTSYITDDVTLSATYGKSWVGDYLNNPTPGLSEQPYIARADLENPAYTGGNSIVNHNASADSQDPNSGSRTRGLRLDLDWQIGEHHLSAGIDNMHYAANDEGTSPSGPGYSLRYGKAAVGNENIPLVPSLGVGAPGGDGYYVYKQVFSTVTSMTVDQRAQYLEDRWQVTDKVLVSVGVRNDRFKNENDQGRAYVNNAAQWAPRLGASWDVFGDSSLKVYGNLGRYYLALPNSVAVRGASPSTYTREYFTYTGIDKNGNPTGLKALGPGPVSSDGEYGQTVDPVSVAARDLRSQYQDEGILGFDKTLGNGWITGAKVTVRKLRTAIDDVCDTDKLADKLTSQGVNPDSVTIPGCLIFNPGFTNTFSLANTNGVGRTEVKMSAADWGFDQGAKRRYYALDLYLDHPFDGKWQARVDYTFSRSYGNTEGQVKSDIGQADISKTQDWDSALLMENSNGLLANDRTHQLKAYGAYQIAPEWLVSGNLRLATGAPKSCLGYLDGQADNDPIGYGSSYHNCNGEPSPPGATRNPWYKQLDLALTYRPSYFDSKLAFGLSVFNVTDERKPLSSNAVYESSSQTVLNNYDAGQYFQTPRYARLSATYDF
jgi:outer membrane receptor protein involved in Fe transport